MKKLNATLAAVALAATGLVSLAPAAEATSVFCSSYGFSGSAGGKAWALNCRHSGVGENTRLRADCKWSPLYSYSPTVIGSFSGMNFYTGKCTAGVKNSLLQHNF